MTTSLKPRFNIGQTFAALQYPNYRLWFIGQLISLAGTWMQNTAQQYLVFELTKSSRYLGYVGFAAGLPTILFTLYGGVIADRIPRRTMLIVTQTTMMILAFILAGLVFAQLVQPWQIILLAFLLGVANAFDAPARVSFVVELVDRKDLTNGIALNATMFNSAAIVGPAIAGIAYASFGAAWCFTLNAISFLAVIIALLLMKLPAATTSIRTESTFSQLKEGVRYVANERIIRTFVFNQGVLSLLGLSIMTLLPAWTTQYLGGDSRTYGMLLSARGIGALTAALMIASLGSRGVRGRLWTTGSLLLPVTILAFAFIRVIPMAAVIILISGWAFMLQVNTSNALVQSQVQDRLRSRVMSVYTLFFFGGMPLGSLLAGQIASRYSEPIALVTSATLLFCFCLFIFIRMPFIRRLN
jgi:MFS family permease